MASVSMFDELGGEPVLRKIVDRFVDRIFDDVMIGFHFRNASRARVKAKEYEFAAAHLGADVVYTGRPIDEAHRRHPIMGGQFMRRLQILKDTLNEFQVPAHIQEHCIRPAESLRHLVTSDAAGRCEPETRS